MRTLRLLLTLAVLCHLAQSGRCDDFTITLNAENTSAAYNVKGPTNDTFFNLTALGTDGDTLANFRNNSQKTIRAIRFVSLYPQKYGFSSNSGGNLFGQAVVSSDGSQILFHNITAPVAPGQWFWMSATPGTDFLPEGRDIFQALMFETDPGPPAGWQAITPQPDQGDLFFKIEKTSKVEQGKAALTITVTVINTGTHPFMFS